MTDVLDLEIRRRIYQLVSKNPGVHARKIAMMLEIRGQLADYHLLYLERNNLISSVKEEGYRRYYVAGKISLTERRRISILGHETPLRIVLFLLEHPNSRHKEIFQQFDIAKSTLTYYLNKLIKHEILSAMEDSGEKRYEVINAKEIVDLLIRYKPYSRIASMKDTFIDLKWPGVP